MSELPAWASEFRPFSWVHGFSLAWTIAPIACACIAGRRWLAHGRVETEQRLVDAWAGFAIGVNLWAITFWHLPDRFDPRVSLPIQPCDVAALVVPLAFLTTWRWPRTLLFFWGTGLSVVGLLLPATLQEGPAMTSYYLYWLIHLIIVGSAAYLIVVRRYRPEARDLRAVFAFTAAYFAAVATINELVDGNYGFIGRTGSGALSDIDSVAPWPDRAAVLIGFVAVVFVVLWRVAARASGGAGRRASRGVGA